MEYMKILVRGGGGQKVGCRFWRGHRKVEYAKDLIGDR